MNSNVQNYFDKASALKEITERKQIVETYRQTGLLNREDAINKIISLRMTDQDVAGATAAVQLSTGTIPFTQATDQQIISELQMQISVLAAELFAKP